MSTSAAIIPQTLARPTSAKKLAIALTAFFASGCSSLPQHPRLVERSSDVANVFVTALPPMGFNDIKTSIAIHHDLKPENCRELAAQTTGSSVFQYLSQIALGASVALPLHTVSNTTTATNGTPSTTSTMTTGSAAIPSSSGAPANTVTPSSLTPDLTKPAPAFEIDGEAQVMGGTSICQAAALVEQQIASAKLPDGYDAYVITFQVNVQPKARDLSYDTDINIELWPTDKDNDGTGVSQGAWNRPPIMVKPLIVTDVLESTSIARSMMAVKQFAASLSGVLPSLAALNAGGSNSNAQLDEALGADRNAVLTMGSPSANTIRIHLGAPSSGSYKYAMVPRTFNISTLVLTKKPKEQKQDDILFVSRSAFRSTDPTVTQQPTSDISREELATRIKTKLCNYKMPLASSPMCGGMPDSCDKMYKDAATHQFKLTDKESGEPGPILDVLRQVDRQNRKFLDACLVSAAAPAPCDSDPNKNDCRNAHAITSEITRMRLYSDLSEIKADSRYSTGIIALPETKQPKPPFEKQLISVVDNGDATSVALWGGSNMDAGNLAAYATVVSAACNPSLAAPSACVLMPTRTAVSTDGSALTLTFPSLSQMKLGMPSLKTIVVSTQSHEPQVLADCPKANERKQGIYCYSSFVAAPGAHAGNPGR